MKTQMAFLLMAAVAGCDASPPVANEPVSTAEDIIAAFAAAYGVELPVGVGNLEHVTDPDLAAAVTKYKEDNRSVDGLSGRLSFRPAEPGEIVVFATRKGCTGGFGIKGDRLVAKVSPSPSGGWVVGPVGLLHPPGHSLSERYGSPETWGRVPLLDSIGYYESNRTAGECFSQLRREMAGDR